MKGRNFANMINGKPVINATRRVTLHISAKDTQTGRTKDPGACAAAKAAMRGIPNCTMARVHLGRAYLYDYAKNHWLRYQTSEALRSEIIAFDRGGTFEPGDYDLRPLSPTNMAAKKKKAVTRSNVENKTKYSNVQKAPRKFHVVKGVRARGANR